MRVEHEGAEPAGTASHARRADEIETSPPAPLDPAPQDPATSPPVPEASAPGPAAPTVPEDPAPAWRPRRPSARGPRPKGSRTGGAWVTAILAAIVLLILLVFILQNLTSVQVSFFGGAAKLPLGVALLLSAICGALLVAIPGTGRILQLRRQYRTRR